MKVLFIIPGANFYDEPLGIMYLAGSLKAAGHEVKAVLASREDPVRAAVEFQPSVVGFGVYTGSQGEALEISRAIKTRLPDVFCVFGGPHPTYFPELVEEVGVDGVCRGEGEESLVELVGALAAGSDHENLAGWWFKREGEIIRNKERPLRTALDELPFPDREIFLRYDTYRDSRLAYFMSGRGCPYECTYCFNHVLKEMYKGQGKFVRQRTVENVLKEIKEVLEKRKNIRFIRFEDDTFILSKTWLKEFSQRYPGEIGLPFSCNVRLDLVTAELAALLRHAGCVTCSGAIEAGNDEVRNGLLRRSMGREEIIEACRIIRREGISLLLQNILGIPGTDLSHDLETLDLNIACRPDYAWASICQPYPRTRLGEFATEQGFFDGDFKTIDPTYHHRSKLSLKNRKEVDYLHKFFALTVRFPRLRPVVMRLISLPDNPLFFGFANIVFRGWKYYSYRTKLGIMD